MDVSAVTHDGSSFTLGDFDGDLAADDTKVELTQGATLNATILVLDNMALDPLTDFIGLV